MSNEVAIRATLETGDAVSNANQLTRALDSLGQAMEKATVAGDSKNAEAYGKLMLSMRKQMLSEAKMGGGAAEEQRNPAMRTVHGITTFLHRGAGYIGSAGSGNVAGAALGAAGDSAGLLESMKGLPAGLMAGGAILGGLVAVGAGANKLAEQFEKVMQPSMELAATLGMLGSDAKKNSVAFSEALNRSAAGAIKYGYTVEEGIQLSTDLGRRGLAKDDAFASSSKIFQYQRATGVDRGTLTEAEALSKRYVAGDALGYAYGGLEQSKMEPGQYQEYLNATLKIFEEGLSRGVVKGFGEVTRAQNMLAAIGTTWKGELGAQRYQQLNNVVTGASDLNSDYDVVIYRAMQNVMKKARTGGLGVIKDKNGKVIEDPNKQYKGYDPSSYVDVAEKIDAGLTPELMAEVMSIIKNQMTNGTEREIRQQIMGLFRVNSTSAHQIYDAAEGGLFKTAVGYAKDPKGSVKTTEQTLLAEIQGMRLDLMNAGQNVLPGKVLVIEALHAITGFFGGSKALEAAKIDTRSVLSGLTTNTQEAAKLVGNFERGYASKDQRVVDATRKNQGLLKEMDPQQQVYLATHKDYYDKLFGDLGTDKGTLGFADKYQKSIGTIPRNAFPGMDYVRGLDISSDFEKGVAGGDRHLMAIAELLKNDVGNDMDFFSSTALKKYIRDTLSKAMADGLLDEQESDDLVNMVLKNRVSQKDKDAYSTGDREYKNRELSGAIFYDTPQQGGYSFKGGREAIKKELGKTWTDFQALIDSNLDRIQTSVVEKIFKDAQATTSPGGSDITKEEFMEIIKKVTEQLGKTVGALSEGGAVVAALKNAATSKMAFRVEA